MTVGITELPPEGMQLGGVALAGDADRGTKTTEGLSLLFTTAGITVQGPQPQIERLLVWSGLDTASCREKIALPDGRNAAVMELTSGGQAIRFLLPMDAVTPGQAAYLDQALPAWLARYKGSVAPGAQSTAPTAAPPPPPTQSPVQSNGGSASSGRQPSGKGSQTDITAPTGPGAPAATPPNGPAPAEVAAAAAAAGAAAASANGTTRGPSDPDPSSAPPAFGSPAAVLPTDPGSAAARPDPSGSSFIARSNIGSLPPSGDALPSGSLPPGLPPPPPTRAPAPGGAHSAGAPAGNAGWETATGAAAFESGPLSGEPTPEVTDPAKKPRGWRKNRSGSDGDASLTTAPEAPTPDFFAPAQPPAEPPSDPVPLKLAGTLPPPPAEDLAPSGTRPITWKPPIDPVTGKPAWDQSPFPVEAPPKKRKAWRKGTKDAAAVGAVGAAGIAGGAALADGPDPVVAPSSAAPFGAGPNQPVTGGEPAPKRNRALLAVLLVVLLVVIGGIAYFIVKKNNDNTTSTTVAGGSVSPRVVADTALATSINLRLTDLPTGWSRSPGTAQPPVPVPPASAQAQAESGLSSCLSQPNGLVAGLFGSSTVPGSSVAASSPTFQSGADSGIQMSSKTTVMTTAAANQVLAAPFANPSFASCFGAYQTALVSSVAPGAAATVQTVALPVPAGVKSYGYLTTFTAPGGRTAIEGEAFIFGARTETRLSPMTNGPAVPQSAFASAYDAITTRVAQDANK